VEVKSNPYFLKSETSDLSFIDDNMIEHSRQVIMMCMCTGG
jgi:hypothetical protein